MLVKNQEILLEITSISEEGTGIGHTGEGMTVFVTDAVPGDEIIAHITKVKKTYAFAFPVKIIRASENRVKEVCPVSKKCGGCSLMHISYEEQLKIKQRKVYDCIKRIGGIENPVMEEIIGCESPFFYRNKAQFPVANDKEQNAVIGFFRKRSHDVVENTKCYIQAGLNETVMEIIRDFLNEFKIPAYDEEKGKGLVRHIFTRIGFNTKEVMVCLVCNGEDMDRWEILRDRLKASIEEEGYIFKSFLLNVNRENTNVILGKKTKTLYGRAFIEDYIGDIKYRISPLSFYQVNPYQTKKLYEKAKEYAGLTGKETVWDLYCGIGTISNFIAGDAFKVYGVEIVPEAINDAKINAKLNNIENTHFLAGAAEDLADSLPKPDVIIVDPPRKGLDEKLLKTIIKVNPKRLVYVSCDPATLARDIKYLSLEGYFPDKICPVDQFPQTMHVETVVLLSKVSK